MTSETGRPAPAEPRLIQGVNWMGVWTLFLKEVRRFVKVGTQTVAAPAVTTLLFLAIFTLALGREIELGADVTFPEFLAPGLVMMAILQNAFQNTSSSLMISKVQGNIVDVLMPPLGPGELVTAYVAAGIVRGLVVGSSTTIVMSIVVGFEFANPLLALFFAIIGSMFLALLGVLAGLWSEKFDHLSAVTNFLITPLTFLSGTFYSIDRLPGIWNEVAHLNPIFWLIDGFRAGMIGWSDSDPMIGAAVVLGLNCVLIAWAHQLLKRGYKLKA